jgi:hypothetical protein
LYEAVDLSDFSPRASAALRCAGVRYIWELAELRESKLSSQPNVGAGSSMSCQTMAGVTRTGPLAISTK